MAFHVKTVTNLSTVTEPFILNGKNFLLLSEIDTYNGDPEPTYEIYRISDKVLLRGYKPTIVEANALEAAINKIYTDFDTLAKTKQNRENNVHGESGKDRGGMLDVTSGYMEVREVANDIARMIRQEDLKDVTDQYVETSELSAVASELYAKGEEVAQEVLDYVGALGMALVTAHGTAMAAAPSAETPTTESGGSSTGGTGG